MSDFLARMIVRVVAATAPPHRRERLVREWHAELWHEANRPGSPGSLRMAWGVISDVGALRRLERNGRSSPMARIWKGWFREARLALRGLRRSPGFTVVSILTLALGMASAVSIFTLIDRIVLDPLPYPESDRLVDLHNPVPGVGAGAEWGMSLAQYVHFSENANSLESVGLYRFLGASIQTPEGPDRAFGWRVTHDLLPMIGGEAQLGRLIRREDELSASPKVVVLSHEFWQTRFGSDPSAIGTAISINDVSYDVVGVLNQGVNVPLHPAGVPADLWVAIEVPPPTFYNSHVYRGAARLAEGVDVGTASLELAAMRPALIEAYPNVYSENFYEGSGFTPAARPMKEPVLGTSDRNLWVLFGAVSIVLLIAVGNVANLFLVRSESRGRELGVREALGAGRTQVGQFLLVEGWMVSLIAAGIALLFSGWAIRLVSTVVPNSLPRLAEIGIDSGTILFTILLAGCVGVVLAAYPMLRGSRLGELGSGSSRSEGPGQNRLRSGLVVAQVALALALVVGAGLLLESVNRIRAIDPGFDAEGVLSADLYLSPERYTTDLDVWSAHRQILERIRGIPGVAAAGMTGILPLSGGFGCTVQGFEDQTVYRTLDEIDLTTCAGQTLATPGYFEAMDMPIVAGRGFSDVDNDGRTGAVIVSQTFADRFFPNQDPIGKGVGPNGATGDPWYRIAGVVGDVKAGSLDGENANAIYYPLVQQENTGIGLGENFGLTMQLAIDTEFADPISIMPSVIEIVRDFDPAIPVVNPMTMTDRLRSSMSGYTFNASLLLTSALMALILAAVGLYGVISYVVARRTREIGMRIAIGAHPSDVQRLFVGRSAKLVGLGLVFGVLLSLGVGRVLEGLLYGVRPTNLFAFTVASGLLAAVGLVATWLPARRASNVAPAEVLRAD